MTDKMKKIKIKGKPYIMVHERVKEFHRENPQGKIETEIIEFSDERFITKTIVTPDTKNPDRFFTGIACEKIVDSSSLENCETSSCGRALGFYGIGVDTSIASYEEVDRAIKLEDLNVNNPKAKENVKKLEQEINEIPLEKWEENEICEQESNDNLNELGEIKTLADVK